MRCNQLFSTGSSFVPSFISDWQIGHKGWDSNEKSLRIQQLQLSLLHVQIAVCSSGVGSTFFLE